MSAKKRIVKNRKAFNFIIFFVLTTLFAPQLYAGEFSVFNKTYIRDNGSPETVTDTFSVINPATTWTLRATNGSLTDDTIEKVSSSTLNINNEEILQANQFNQNTGLLEATVTLNETNTVETTLNGKPGGQLTVEIVGTDDNPPVISSVSPADGSITPTSQPIISANYSDDISGIDVSTVKVTLDGNDITITDFHSDN